MSQENAAYCAALQVIQEAINVLAGWSNQPLASHSDSQESDAVKRAKHILSWNNSHKIKPLKSLFDSVKLSRGQDKVYYWHPQAISNNYPRIP
ncbi:MAG: type III-A CRISPR-associated protein Cas10/Csm1, partial [Rivularia sp. (in: cyanobacteria)]